MQFFLQNCMLYLWHYCWTLKPGRGRQSQWYDFTVDMNHLFIRSIYSKEKLTKMKNMKYICSYLECFELFIELNSIIENAIENSQWMTKKKIEDFMRYDLNDVNSHLGEVKQAIDDVNVFKKILQELLYRQNHLLHIF